MIRETHKLTFECDAAGCTHAVEFAAEGLLSALWAPDCLDELRERRKWVFDGARHYCADHGAALPRKGAKRRLRVQAESLRHGRANG